MSLRNRLAITLFAIALIAATATVVVVLVQRSGQRGNTPLGRQQISFCYPNQGTSGC